MSSSIGLDASLALLRHELEGMQQQDKTLYTQLLTLRESIRGLKTELRKEREECEETFKNLEESSGQQLEDDEVFLENETEVFKTQDEWKHDRQDSGISVKTPEGETQDVTSKHLTQDDSSSLAPKPGIISHSKHDLEPQERTRDVETTQKTTAVQSKPVLIQHSKQDSGILIDEEAVRETKLLSRLVESSEMFQKLENRKFDRIIQDRWQKARENPLGSRNEVHERPLVNRESMYQHQRSRSSNDLLSRPGHQRTLPQQLSVGGLRPRHSHTYSCPQTLTGKEFQTVEKQPLKQFFELHINEKLEKSQVEKTEGSTQRKELQNRTELQSVKKPQFQHFTELHRDLNEKLEKARVQNLETNEGSTQRPSTPSTPTSPGQGAPSPVPLLTPRHSHTRSLPVSSMRGFIMPEKQLSRKENRRSMENISDHKVVPAHHVRPRQRSASVVDLDSNDVIESRGSPRQNSVIPHKTSVVHVDSLNQYKDVAQNKAVYINNIKQESNLTQAEVKAAKPLRAVLVSACEVNVSNITDRQTLSRRPSLDEKTRNCRPSEVTRRLTLTRTDCRISPRPGLLYQNTPRSPRFLSPQSSRNHLRHHTMPEYDVMKRRHSFIWHAPSKSWDGYARKPKDGRGLTRSVSQVSFV